MNDIKTLQEKLELVRKDFLEKLPSRINQIEKSWNLLQTLWDPALFKVFFSNVHNIVGSGRTFNFEKLGSIAFNFETILKPYIENAAYPKTQDIIKINKLIIELKNHATELQQLIISCQENMPELELAKNQDKRLIYLVEDERNLAQTLSLKINQFGYNVVIFNQLSNLKEAVNNLPPAAIIMDIMFPEGRFAGIESINNIMTNRRYYIPVIFISSRNDIATRIQAVRAGGSAYFKKPVDIIKLIDKLDLITMSKGIEPFRIYILDDDKQQGEYYATALKQVGMITKVDTESTNIIEQLDDFNPDLILMDVYMPKCTGIELAKVIRQVDTYVSVPIVFLSIENRLDKQLFAMKEGGDDFLIKPAPLDQLISLVTIRAERMRHIRTFTTRDSLTWFLNHTATKKQLDIEIARAKRQNSKLAYAMIDIDDFKLINDKYGHPVGDRVIKSLSRLLQQRLRKIDIIGRYGGEEFVVILIDVDSVYGVKILDEIRQSFSKISYKVDNRKFTITFSCGIATYPEFKDAYMLSLAADKALYKAKDKGKNTVLLAPE